MFNWHIITRYMFDIVEIQRTSKPLSVNLYFRKQCYKLGIVYMVYKLGIISNIGIASKIGFVFKLGIIYKLGTVYTCYKSGIVYNLGIAYNLCISRYCLPHYTGIL